MTQVILPPSVVAEVAALERRLQVLEARQPLDGPYLVSVSGLAVGAEASVDYTHSRGQTARAVFYELEDGSFAGRCIVRVTRTNATKITFTVYNTSGGTATVYINFVVMW